MRWLWFVAPLVALATYVLLILGSTTEDRRRKAALLRWLDELLGPLLGKDGKPLNRRVKSLPADLLPMVEEQGGGARVADVVLVPQEAYLAVRAADGEALSSQHTVVCRLAKPAPRLVVRPLPIVEGRPLENRGLVLDDAFAEAFIVEGGEKTTAKVAKRWLGEELRAALLELPEVWLRAEGTLLAVTLYGSLDADQIDALVAAADALYARHGATAATLFGDGERAGSQGAEPAVSRVRPKAHGRPVSDVAEGEIAPSAMRLRAGAIDLALYGVGGLLVALTNGSFASFHPSELFQNPDVTVKEPWQGGFTTFGFGMFTCALILFVGTFALQTYLAAHRGSSIGKRLVGLAVVREDGSPVDFVHGVLLRSWLPGAAVLALAAYLTRPFSTGAMFARLLTYGPSAFAFGLVALGVATLSRDRDARGFHDKLGGTKVVETEPLRLVGVQLASSRGLDPILFGQLMRALGVAGVFAIVMVAVSTLGPSFQGVPLESLPLLVMGALGLVALLVRLVERRKA
jgi:uncharacterized RDD family membrane protein YckC